MSKNQKSEEELKADIFNLFFKCRDESSSDRRQVYSGQLCELIFRWCIHYPFNKINAKEMGLEIVKLVLQLVKDNSKAQFPKTQNGFFQYLRKALYNAKADYHRTYESGPIKIPKGKLLKLKKMDEIIRMEESNLGRNLKIEECVKCLSEWLNIPKNEAIKYFELKKMKNVKSLTINHYDNERNITESEKVMLLYPSALSFNPEVEFFSQINVAKNDRVIKESINTVLDNMQNRTLECYRSLLTGFFISNSIDIERFSMVLDTGILEEYRKSGKFPNLYEIYYKFHHNVKKESAEVRASEMLKKLLFDLSLVLKNNNFYQ